MTTSYKFKCNLLMEPPNVDRFYMDMRVYSVVPTTPDVEVTKADSLVWRGIYLAFQVDPASKKA